MPKCNRYTFEKHQDADARRRSAHRIVQLLLQPDPEITQDHRRELLNIALWKLTEAESVHKHGTRYCSEAAFANPNEELRHDHVYQRAEMVKKLLEGPNTDIAAILAPTIGCTITKEEHRLLNRHKHLDGWARYEAAGIKYREVEPS